MLGCLTASLADKITLPHEMLSTLGISDRSATRFDDQTIVKTLSDNLQLNALEPPQSASLQNPVLQLAHFSQTLNPDLYKNASCSANPNGNLKSAYCLRQLTDPLPCFQKTYLPSPASLEINYGLIINNVQVTNPVSRQLFAQIQGRFAQSVKSSLSGSPSDTWRLVEADPIDWWDTEQVSYFKETTLDLNKESTGASFTILGGDDWPTLNFGKKASIPISSGTSLKSISFRAQFVTLHRSWLDTSLFLMPGWSIEGVTPGFCSSGDIIKNNGILRLVPFGLLIGYDAEVDISWAPEDEKFIKSNSEQPLSLGPFPLYTSGKKPTLFLAAVISFLVPFSPAG